MIKMFNKEFFYIKLIIFAIIGVSLWSCNDSKTQGKRRNATRIDLELIWTGMGDRGGIIDVKTDSAIVEAAEFSPDGKIIATGSRNGRQLIIWNVKNEQKLFEQIYDNTIESLCFSSDGNFLYVGGEFNYLSVRNTKDWSLHENIPLPSGIEGMHVSNDGKILALGREDGMVSYMELTNHTIIDSLLHGMHGAPPKYGEAGYRADVNSLDFTPDDNYLITGGFDGEIKIWDISAGKVVKKIKGHEGSIKMLRMSNNGTCFASASSGIPYEGDNSIKIWDFKTGDLLHELTSPIGSEAVEFTPCGEFLLGGTQEMDNHNTDIASAQGQIYVYSIPDDFMTQPISLVHKEQVMLSEYFCFNKDGSLLVSGHNDGTVRLWKVLYR